MPLFRPVAADKGVQALDLVDQPLVQQELQRSVGPRVGISVFGDRWLLALPTGRRQVFGDVETLAGALVAQGLVDGRTMPAGVPLEQVLSGSGDPGPPPLRERSISTRAALDTLRTSLPSTVCPGTRCGCAKRW